MAMGSYRQKLLQPMIEKFELQYKTGTSLTGVITGNDRDVCSTLYNWAYFT